MERQNKRIASRYARALLEVAIESNVLDLVYDDMMLINQVIQDSDELRIMFKNKVIKNYKKNKIVEAIFSSKVSVLSMSFIRLLIDKNHETIMNSIIMEFFEHYRNHKGIKSAYVETMLPLSADSREALLKKLAAYTGKKIELHEKINPELIGGYRLRLDDYLYDCSLDEKLKILSKEFEKNIYEKGY